MFSNRKSQKEYSDFFLGEMERNSHSPSKPTPKKPAAKEKVKKSPAPLTKEEKKNVTPYPAKRKKPMRAKRDISRPLSAEKEGEKEKKTLPLPEKKEEKEFSFSQWLDQLKKNFFAKKEEAAEEITPPEIPEDRKEEKEGEAEHAPEKAPTANKEEPEKEKTPAPNEKKPLTAQDYVRYAVLFVCIFGFLTAGFFVCRKLYEYYRAHVIYSQLQEMVTKKDRFSEEYLKKALSSVKTLTPEDILAGKTGDGEDPNSSFSEEQETLVGKIGKLKKINPDTVGWITIDGTVVNYPVVWSQTKDYYLRRDFYGKKLASGTIYVDERNSPDLTKNRNTVIYGHNMSDGSMFASIHDFSAASVFYDTKIQIATEQGIFIFTPFSVHESHAMDNYFETDFVSDEDFLNFCDQMAFISIFETEVTFNKNSQIITLSTCMDNQSASEQRFVVHALLTQVIR